MIFLIRANKATLQGAAAAMHYSLTVATLTERASRARRANIFAAMVPGNSVLHLCFIGSVFSLMT